ENRIPAIAAALGVFRFARVSVLCSVIVTAASRLFSPSTQLPEEDLSFANQREFDLDQGPAGFATHALEFPEGYMYWQPFYYFRHSLRSSLWTVPIVAIPFAMFVTRLAHWLDERLQWTLLGFGPKGAEALLQATATA